MTYKKKGVLYFTLSGNTTTMLKLMELNDFEFINIKKTRPADINLEQYDLLIIATSSIGDGVPPYHFKRITPQLRRLEGKDIGLMGSGNTIYRYFCGALDLLEDLLCRKNNILFKFKFEEYPTEEAVEELKSILLKNSLK